jgi:hypothetical protein
LEPAIQRVTSWTLSWRNDKGSFSEGPKTCGQISRAATLSVRTDKLTLLGHAFAEAGFGQFIIAQ